MNIFLQGLAFNSGSSGISSVNILSLIPPAIIGIFIGLVAILIIFYVYLSLAYMGIGKKAGLKSPGVSWISPIISIFEISQMHWWPWPTLIIGFLASLALLLVSPLISVILSFILMILFLVMTVIWQWKTFEVVNRPGWWALVAPICGILGYLLTFLNSTMFSLIGLIIIIIGSLVHLVFIGIAAWGN